MQKVPFSPIVKSVLPASWYIEESDGLYAYSSPKSTIQIPSQGWKIFVSCHFFNAESVIQSAAKICVEDVIAFKFVRSRFLLATELLGKSFPREESAKAVVIYPTDTDACHTTLLKLAESLHAVDVDAPPVLSGRCFANAPVYYRYGSNSEKTPDGYAYLRDPETGERVRDMIRPWYETPPWIDTDPFQPDLDKDSESIIEVGQFTIQEAISFSNSGGIYLAKEKTTESPCLIKEGRRWMAPHPETGEDAMQRLAREAETLRTLNPDAAAPEYISFFTEDDHAFLVRAYIEGETLVDRIQRGPFGTDELENLANALEIGILRLKEQLPDTRLDLSPDNVIFDGSTIKVLDFETERSGEYTWGTHGFIPPPGVCPWRWAITSLLDYSANASESDTSD